MTEENETKGMSSKQVTIAACLGVAVLAVALIGVFGGKKKVEDDPDTAPSKTVTAGAYTLTNTSWTIVPDEGPLIEVDPEEKRKAEEAKKRWQNLDIFRRDY